MAAKSNAKGEMLSFGVEMEFYIAYRTRDKNYVFAPPEFISNFGSPLRIPGGRNHFFEVLEALKVVIRNLLPGKSTARVTSNDQINFHDQDWAHLSGYRDWDVKADSSLNELPVELDECRTRHYGWVGVEVVSPALWATNEGFDEVRKVCEFIRNSFWTYTPPNAGLHIHVGNGNKRFPISSVRQMGALLFAADHILAQSHPEHRRKNTEFCPNIRLYSNLSFGMKNRHAPQRPVQLDEPEQRQSKFSQYWQDFLKVITPNSQPSKPQRNQFPPRPKTGSYRPDPVFIGSLLDTGTKVFGIRHERNNFRPVPILEGVQELLVSTNIETISQLLDVKTGRPTYNFRLYPWEPKRTIEFRQPAATVDPVQVVSQARTAVRLCEFATNASYEELIKVIQDCSSAEEHPSWFDVYDLFFKIGLEAEAKIVHAVSMGTMSDEVRREYWRSRGSY